MLNDIIKKNKIMVEESDNNVRKFRKNTKEIEKRTRTYSKGSL